MSNSDRYSLISDLGYYARFYEVRTAIRSVFGISFFHIAILDCEKQVILEGGCDDKGFLSIREFPLLNGTMNDYVIEKEKIRKLSAEDDFQLSAVNTKETYNERKRLIGDMSFLYSTLGESRELCFIFGWETKDEFIAGLSWEEDIEKRWLELEKIPDGKCEYDFSGHQGWNCESVVSYIVRGVRDEKQGKLMKFLKKGGIDRQGRIFGIQSRSSSSKSSKT